MQLRVTSAWNFSDRSMALAGGREALHATACFVAISLSFLVYGVLQERMMTVGFGPERELFKSSLFIVFCNRLLTSGIAFLVLIMQQGSALPVAPLQSYAAVSCGNLIASTCQYDSLKYISFALQTLAKCCKMLPVMVWGVAIRRKKYSAIEIATASFVTVGCAMFIFSGSILSPTAATDTTPSHFYSLGIMLLLSYLLFDGFASTWQDTLFSGYEMDTSNQVLYTALCSTALSFVVLLTSQDMFEAIWFLKRHPHAIVYITAVSSVATIIQYFVSYTIKTYGALNFATLMTARQFLSVIASSVIFHHKFTIGQWLGCAVVFSSLGLNMMNRQRLRLQGRKPTTPSSVTAKISNSPLRTPHQSSELHMTMRPLTDGSNEAVGTITSTPVTTGFLPHAETVPTTAGWPSPQGRARSSTGGQAPMT